MIIKGYWKTKEVYIDGKRLLPDHSQIVFSHSPDGFIWGYGGFGPAQLALAILLLVLHEKLAVSLHQEFKWEYIAILPQADFEIEIDLEKWVAKKRFSI